MRLISLVFIFLLSEYSQSAPESTICDKDGKENEFLCMQLKNIPTGYNLFQGITFYINPKYAQPSSKYLRESLLDAKKLGYFIAISGEPGPHTNLTLRDAVLDENENYLKLSGLEIQIYFEEDEKQKYTDYFKKTGAIINFLVFENKTIE